MTDFANVYQYATPMTKEGVSQPSHLSREGQAVHFMRRSGPGTRSKNPAKYDAEKRHRDRS